MTASSKLKSSNYESVEMDEEYDSRIPLHPEEAFLKGISYKAKYIGTLEIPKPTSRLEIVSSMRRIRYEFKARSIKKKYVSLIICADGLKVYLKKRRRKNRKSRNPDKHLVLHHPIYRIFYVSHDSQDLKIFSFIARESQSSNFTCSVFKAKKKRHAIRLVRTIGQAFDICNKLADNESEDPEQNSQACSNLGDSEISDPLNSDLPPYESTEKIDLSLQRPHKSGALSSLGESTTNGSLSLSLPDQSEIDDLWSSGNALLDKHVLQEKFQHQQQHTLEVIKQARALRDALTAERAARLEAQARSQELLLHNRQLVSHIGQLVSRLCVDSGSPAQQLVQADVIEQQPAQLVTDGN